MNYYIYAIHPNNIDKCIKNNLIAVRKQGLENLKKAKKGDKIIFYSGKKNNGFIGYGVVQGDYFLEKKKIIWDDERTSKKILYPHRLKVKFLKYGKFIPIKDIINDISFIKNKKNMGFTF